MLDAHPQGASLCRLRPDRNLPTICRVDPLTVEIHDRGLDIAERYRFSLYDAMIVAAALLGKCATLYSEDLQHRQQIDQQLTIVNPFETS
jgi:predicted nucleic acid-binding protein